MSSVSQGDGFIKVTRGSKKRKASTSPTLPSKPKPGSPLETPVRPKPYRKNTTPVIISGVDETFKSWRKLTGELNNTTLVPKFQRSRNFQKVILSHR